MLPIWPAFITAPAGRPSVSVAGPWSVAVASSRQGAPPTLLQIEPPARIDVRGEMHASLPIFNPTSAPWTKGARLAALVTFETTGPDLLVPGSVSVRRQTGGAGCVRGRDYEIDDRWGTIGRLLGGSIDEEDGVEIDYSHYLHRIDAVVRDRRGRVRVRRGTPHNATPAPPGGDVNEAVLANIWLPGGLAGLTDDHVFAVSGKPYRPPRRAAPPAVALLPRTWRLLQDRRPLHVLAWGDSVTAGGQASDQAHQWQHRFVAMLGARFPGAPIRLTTAGWGGRNSDSFLNEPPGSPFNFDGAVIAPKPDLIVMEFVNDAYMTPDVVDRKYSALLERFQAVGAEWIILTPHFVWPEWMGCKTTKVTEDPRPYVRGVREFCARRRVALADASRRWGHLADEGIPYVTLLSNSLNHPDDRGHELFALSAMELFTDDRSRVLAPATSTKPRQ